ncbi:putative DNA binding domain-containing protein [Vibrio sp. JC009]|uniref:RNA-binding domain-containing protein n=1 Tax=Vibrio sp. JC009 TaxID=2912314 RepID=UPI0023B13068|nr:RNA-binding domain-containing protein [Vibrio sp. JC009]WED21685.1 putative DNA binding domain-containing protein [Vibrio sp. JC009]
MNFTIQDIIDLQTLAESAEVEFKLAGGKSGKGQLPKDFWPTYSAMANGRGGWVILGVKEKDRHFTPVGVTDIEKVKIDLFNQLSDRDRVSINLLADKDVQTVIMDGKEVLAIHIPPATRKQKPVYMGKNPLAGKTYIRLHEGDRICGDETVKRMLAEQLHDSRDNEVLSEHYNFDEDIDLTTLNAYRNLLAAHNPDHPFLASDLFDFFKQIGGWRTDKETGKRGITLAGVLMFGTWDAITSARPNYFVDYQERPEAKTELRWIDRVYYDGTWSGNLFDFYRKVYQKLTADLKVPFKLEDGQRKNDTPVHIAIREALINSLVHADFSDRLPILIVKRPDLFGFRNPGLMRIPLEDVIAGGLSDCRNQTLQKMFMLIGLSERAGSGIPKIYSGWSYAKWRKPKLWERPEPAQTILELSTAGLIPEETMDRLHDIFGDTFYKLDELETKIVVTAAVENWVNHERACELTEQHTREVTLILPRLVNKGFLVAAGEGKNKYYTLPGVDIPTPDKVFVASELPKRIASNDDNITHKSSDITQSSTIITQSGKNITQSSTIITQSDEQHNANRDENGRLISKHLPKPVIDDLSALSKEFYTRLKLVAEPARKNNWLAKEQMKKIIVQLCDGHFIEIAQLATLLGRTNQNVRQHHLKALLEEKKLELAFPQTPRTKRQAYSKKDS